MPAAAKRSAGTVLGRSLSDVRRRVGSLEQVAGARLVELADGTERGVRLVEIRTGGGLAFEVVVDRGFGLGQLFVDGIPVAYQAAGGIPGPWYADSGDWSFLRQFSGGLLVTGGLDHVGAPRSDSDRRFGHPLQQQRTSPMHGRVSSLPGRLSGYGLGDRDGRPEVFAEGEVRQSELFGENLVLRRRVSADVGGRCLRIEDAVTNDGARPTPHALLHHLNFGWPLVDEGSLVFLPDAARPARVVDPRPDATEQVDEVRLGGREGGDRSATIVSPRLGLGITVTVSSPALRWLFLWRCLRDGEYVVGLEPCTERSAEERVVLPAGSTARYEVVVTALRGAELDPYIAAQASTSCV